MVLPTRLVEQQTGPIAECTSPETCGAYSGLKPHHHGPDDDEWFASCVHSPNCLIHAHQRNGGLTTCTPGIVFLDVQKPEPEAELFPDGDVIVGPDDVDEDAYHRHPALSVSTAKQLVKPGGPYRVRYEQINGRPSNKNFDFGHAAHAKVLGVGAGLVVVGDDFRSRAAQQARDEAYAAGLTPVTTAQAAKVDLMAAAIDAHPLAHQLLTDGFAEQSMFSTDEVTGRRIRGRCDFYQPATATMTDYKSAAVDKVTAEAFMRSVIAYGYDQQDAWYRWLGDKVGLPVERFVFIAHEKEAPFRVHCFELDDEFRRRGTFYNRKALAIWDECLTSGEWPGFPQHDTTILSPPEWAMREVDAVAAVSDDDLAAMNEFLNSFEGDDE